jgi:RimJ/RimL family protein N-acetyltransferase
MTDFKLKVREGIYLSAIRETDKPALLEHLQSRDIYRTTMHIPHPYTEADADSWIAKRIGHTKRVGKEGSFAIRHHQGVFIGAVGADNFEPGLTHWAEIGYWLARPFWGQGIMTDVVRAYVRYAFDELHVIRLIAHVLEFNAASARVLEKNGFKLEGSFRKHFMKDGELLDARF